MHRPSMETTKCIKQILKHLKRKIDNKIIVEGLNTPLSVRDSSYRQIHHGIVGLESYFMTNELHVVPSEPNRHL